MTEKLYNDVKENIKEIKDNVKRAAESVGRDPNEIKIMAVTKTVEPELVNVALENGITLLGESRSQEMQRKIAAYETNDDVDIHFIGALQSNKVRQIIDDVSMIQSMDRMSLVKEIEKQAASRDIVMDTLIQVNIGREKTKSGIMPENMVEFIKILDDYPHIRLRGLMSIPPLCDTLEETEEYFERLRQLFVDMQQKIGDNETVNILSMGMSGDYESAIRHGSNLVRIGTSIFGERD